MSLITVDVKVQTLTNELQGSFHPISFSTDCIIIDFNVMYIFFIYVFLIY